jgi:two-component system, LuxR family, sensor kinase FixL
VPILTDAVGQAAEQALRAGRIIRHLREFVARGESERHIESLPKLIEEASALALVGAKERGVRVVYRLDPTAEHVLADRIQIQQVLLNLIRNAIEAMQETENRNLVIATTARDDGMVEVSVADTGTGLAPDVMAQLFQPFVTTKPHGMGVGLSICRTIVEAHGGKIWVESQPDNGTIFRFTLRALADDEIEIG